LLKISFLACLRAVTISEVGGERTGYFSKVSCLFSYYNNHADWTSVEASVPRWTLS